MINKLFNALTKSSISVSKFLSSLVKNKKIDNIDEIQEILLSTDIGYKTTSYIIEYLKKSLPRDYEEVEIISNIQNIVSNILQKSDKNILISKDKLNVILLCGVNGNGKTTTIAKLSYLYMKQGKKILVAAADKFRAAAEKQMEDWCNIIGCDFFSIDSNPATICFNATKKAIEDNYDILIIDTAGRLNNQINLMQELSKIEKTIYKANSECNLIKTLVMEANTGQHALEQIKKFNEYLGLDGMIMTKLDGSSKAGILVSIAQECDIPFFFLGIGEKKEDLIEFNPTEFSKSLFQK